MAHLIDKTALLAEIERRKDICNNVVITSETPVYVDYYQGKAEAYKETIALLNTLEVKEVDLEYEWVKYFENRGDMATVNIKHLAKHFFELGMSVSNKAQKGEKV